ncbi:MAG TPA: hypothetical protein PK076_07500 [Saprospiraceae bacterium]|nr:hypothetical protein [Saprospiraceae bacterium]
MKKIINLTKFQQELHSNSKLKAEFEENPMLILSQNVSVIPDNPVYRIVVCSLGAAILLVLIGIIVLALFSKPLDPNVLTLFTAIASGAVGALAGLLAPTPQSN